MYPKRKILESKQFAGYRDILNALLEDDVLYSIEQVQTILEAFLTKEVE